MSNVVGNKILDVLQYLEYKGDERFHLTLRLHFIVFDTQRAIFDLVRLGHLISAFSLQRVMLETNVKADWLYLCASDEQIEQFKNDNVKSKKYPKRMMTFQEMITDIEGVKPHLDGSLSDFKKYHWKGLNSFTHSGAMQLNMVLNNDPEQLEGLSKTALDFAQRFAISSLISIGQMTENIKVLEASVELSKTRLGLGE